VKRTLATKDFAEAKRRVKAVQIEFDEYSNAHKNCWPNARCATRFRTQRSNR
jgi:hypothetical protein